MGLTYLASPYTDDDPDVIDQRISDACFATAYFREKGKYIFSPIAYANSFRHHLLTDFDHKDWLRFDTQFLINCDELYVLMLHGWTDSYGVRQEIELAELLDRPITFFRMENDHIWQDMPWGSEMDALRGTE